MCICMLCVCVSVRNAFVLDCVGSWGTMRVSKNGRRRAGEAPGVSGRGWADLSAITRSKQP
jgi:hypothetical protein